MGSTLINADRRTDRQADRREGMTKLSSAFRVYANVPKKEDSVELFCHHRWGVSVTKRNEHRHNTNKYNLKYELTKTTNQQLVALGDYCGTANCLTKIYRDISRAMWNFSRYFKSFICSVIPRFLAEPLTMFCGTLVGKHWPRETEESHEKLRSG
jgi:glutathione peroxidase-family protein